LCALILLLRDFISSNWLWWDCWMCLCCFCNANFRIRVLATTWFQGAAWR